jgi:hypothetical protein
LDLKSGKVYLDFFSWKKNSRMASQEQLTKELWSSDTRVVRGGYF